MRHNDKYNFQKVCLLARAAGQGIMAVYETLAPQQGVETRKPDGSPVTRADIAAHQVISAGLQALSPDTPVVSEEDADSHRFRQMSGAFWLVDPLDGTKAFISKTGEFTVNIALIIDSEPVWGVVYAPAVNELFWGGKSIGAWSQIGSNPENSLRVSNRQGFQLPIRVVASRSHINLETQVFINKLPPHGLVQAGSSLKFCKIAQNQADIYPRLSPTCEWDTAAAQAVLEGAGGFVYDIEGSRLKYGKAEVLNPSFIASAIPFNMLSGMHG